MGMRRVNKGLWGNGVGELFITPKDYFYFKKGFLGNGA